MRLSRASFASLSMRESQLRTVRCEASMGAIGPGAPRWCEVVQRGAHGWPAGRAVRLEDPWPLRPLRFVKIFLGLG